MASAQQNLLFSLRSTTTSLRVKLLTAKTAIANSSSPVVDQVLRDWILQDLFLRSRTPKDELTLLSIDWWSLLSQVIDTAQGTSSTPSLPIFVSLFASYPAAGASPELLRAVGKVWSKIGAGAMRKATVDAALEGYASLLKSSVAVLERVGTDVEAWEELAESWLKVFRGVVDAGKGGKKIPLHTLANLPFILPLLAILSPNSSLYDSLLVTVQFSLFNVDNLRRGIARESYNAGGGLSLTDKDNLESASGELLSALRICITNTSASEPHVLHALPLLFTLYRTSLATHSATLFPLPARTSFPTASAALSASEIHSLQKRRALAAGWLKGVATLLGWKEAGREDGEKAACLWKTVEEVENGDLFRDAKGEGWEGVLESLVDGSVLRLSSLTPSSTSSRESLIGLLGSIMRLSFSAVSPSLPSILASLSTTPSTPTSPSTTSFLTSLLTHHSRSLLLPSLLLLLSTALAVPSSVPNNLLTTHVWTTELRTALGGMIGTSTTTCWDALVAGIDEALGSAATEDGERSKKRRKTGGAGAAARIRVLALLVEALPAPLPVQQFGEFRKRWVDEAVKGKEEAGNELLGVRYAMVERMRREGVEGGEEWRVRDKRRKGLVTMIGSEDGEVVLEVARTLLQSIVTSTTAEVAQTILGALLARITTPDKAESAWSGHVQGVKGSEIPAALWELISRRWLTVFEQFGTPEQHAEIAQLVVGSMVSSSSPELIAIDTITARLLRRADFYELRQLQTHVQVAVLARITIPGLSPSSEVLAAFSAKKAPKVLRALAVTTVSSTIASFDRIASLLPMEYVGKALRNDMIDRAVGLDIWVSGGKVELDGEELARAQFVLRKFVVLAAAEGSSLTEGPAILSHLVKSTRNASPAHLHLSIDLYKHFTKSAIASYKSEKNAAVLIAYLEAFETPLADLAKRCKKGLTSLTCEELAFFSLCDTLASSLGELKSLPSPLVDAIRAAAKSASKPFANALASTTVALEADASAVHRISDMLNACRSLWRLKDWIAEGSDHDQVELYSTFAQSVLAHLAASPATADDFVARLAMLDLLAFRVIRLRAISDSVKVSTLPFETFLACHLTFRQSLQATDAASAALEENLRRATSSATLREYTAALDDIAGAVAVAVAPESDASSLEPALRIALVLLRDGPEGSSRLSSACLSELLRHLSFFLLRHTSPTSTMEASSGEPVAKAFLVVAKFLEGICGDRPMLLSRQNVSSVLALVSRMLQPSGTTLADSLPESSYVPTSSAISSSLFLSLVSIVAHLVRHRKDHITPLFPHLVSTLASFLSALRRAGFGTTGSSTTFEDADAGLALGRRAQREARATFPFWVWDGGAKGISRNEAKAVGRLLASLTSKTAAKLKRKHGVDKDNLTISLSAPLSKHAPFVILPYLRACVHAIAPIPSALRSELQGGWFEVMDVMGKWEREALMKGFLRDEEEAERGVLRGMWRTWEKERYRG